MEGIDGRKLDDCDPLIGDSIRKQVTWKGSGSTGVVGDRSVRMRFRMRSAKLFSFELQ